MSKRETPKPTASDASDTSGFRRTWDRAHYAEQADLRESKLKSESAARYEAKLLGRKYHARPPSPSSLRDTDSRASRLDVTATLGRTTILPAGTSATGKRGHGAGFYCPDCDLTFKDNLQFVDHLNSKQHLLATGQSGEVRRASLAEVKERLEWLAQERERVKNEVEGEVRLKERLERRQEEMEREREEKRRKRREKRRKTEGGLGVKAEDVGTVGAGIIC
ncbi:MAG: hypothetical protein LQ342_006269 [Letrouitia transgressa]|nr:MAG: hypothetical protein LQ342_006269 [Letrouitia transgressa]